MESSIKEVNKTISILRKEIEECRRKTIDNKRELQGLMRIRWSLKGIKDPKIINDYYNYI